MNVPPLFDDLEKSCGDVNEWVFVGRATFDQQDLFSLLCESRFASTQPADPPPTMMKSN